MRARATSRCRCSATAARSRASASASARCSGASRSWSRSRPALSLSAGAARAHHAGGAAHGAGRGLPAASAPSNSWSTSSRRPALRLHRSQSAAAGRAHGDRGGHRARPGPAADRASPAGQSLAALGLDRNAQPRRSAASRSSGASTPRRSTRTGNAGRPAARCPLRPAGGPGHARRHARLCGLAPSPHYDSLLAKLIVHSRLAALRRRAAALAARARRIRDRGRRDQPAVAARDRRAARVRDAGACTRASSKSTWPTLLAAAAHVDAHAAKPARPARKRSRRRRCGRPERRVAVTAPMTGAAGAVRGRATATCVPPGAQLAVLEAMKMEHLLHAPHGRRACSRCCARAGD